MSIFDRIQNSRLLIHYITIIIVIAGLFAFTQFRREARPNVNFNRVSINASWSGASPDDMEQLIIKPIEEKILEVDGIEEFRSVALAGTAKFSISIDDKHPTPSRVVDDIRRRVGEIQNLPKDVEPPKIREHKAESIPVLRIAASSPTNSVQFYNEIEKLKEYLKLTPGVQSVQTIGLKELNFKIEAEPKLLENYDITLLEIAHQLRLWTRQKSGGQFESQDQEYHFSVGENRNTLEKLSDIKIRANIFGKYIRLDELANISLGTKELEKENYFFGENATLITVIKKPRADAVEVVDQLNSKISRYQKLGKDDFKLKVYNDQSKRIRLRLKSVSRNAIFGLFFVLLILICFLDFRSALVTSLGIPVAILGGLFALLFFGHTMNSLLVIGLIIVLGMLVDDAIVVCENIYSHLEKGASPIEASIKGVKQVAIPVISTVLTTIVAFAPLVFMEGIIGQFIKVIPLTVVTMLVFSLFEALVILPVHASDFLKAQRSKKTTRFFTRAEIKYRQYIRWSLKNRKIVMIVFLLFGIVSLHQTRSVFKRFSLFPAVGLNGFSINFELDKNTPKSSTRESALALSASIQKILNRDVESIHTTVGEYRNEGVQRVGANLGQVRVEFIDDDQLYKREKAILSSVRQELKRFKESHRAAAVLNLDRPGPPVGKSIQLQITSRDFALGNDVAEEIKAAAAKIPGIYPLESDVDGDRKKIIVNIDHEKATALGIDVTNISQSLLIANSGLPIDEILKGNDQISVNLEVSKKEFNETNQLLKLKIRNKFGEAIPLEKIVSFQEAKGASSIQRLNGSRTITLFGEVDETVISGKEANKKLKPFLNKLSDKHPGLRFGSGGREKKRMEAVTDTMKLYIFALVLIFMVISLSFQSVWIPLYVMVSIPVGLAGVIWALLIHGQTLSMMGCIGIVGLSGVVVNVSILFMSFIRDKLKEGQDLFTAIENSAVERLRPIVITTITTLVGLIPTIYGIGGTDTFVQPLALALGWGLFIATTISLATLPALVATTWRRS